MKGSALAYHARAIARVHFYECYFGAGASAGAGTAAGCPTGAGGPAAAGGAPPAPGDAPPSAPAAPLVFVVPTMLPMDALDSERAVFQVAKAILQAFTSSTGAPLFNAKLACAANEL